MAKIRVFDPACGSGNFLVIAYKEMRAIEAEINKRRGEPDRSSEIPLTNFRGIELRDFPAEIARLALIIAEYQCDVLYRGQKLALGRVPAAARRELDHLRQRAAARLAEHLPADGNGREAAGGRPVSARRSIRPQIDFENEGGETYICGNPPYLGSNVAVRRAEGRPEGDLRRAHERAGNPLTM